MSSEQFFYSHPVFRHEEFASWKRARGEVKAASVNSALRYFSSSGRICPIRRELYAVVPPGYVVENIVVDPYLVAAKATSEGVLGFHTALELHGVAYSSFEQFYFISQHKIKPFEFSNQYFQAVTPSKKLKQRDNLSVEVETINRQGVDIKITTIERTFVDVLDRINLGGGWEEVMRSIESVAILNIDRVIDYSLLLDKAVLNAKVGWCLEQRHGAFAPTEAQLKRLLAKKPMAPRYVERIPDEPFKLVKRWNILLPQSVVDKSWEEPSYDV